MKRKTLYTAGLLSLVGALTALFPDNTIISRANAGVILDGTIVHPQVDFVGTFSLSRGTELKFGVVVDPASGQTVNVSPSGQVSGSAKLLGMGNLNASPIDIQVSTVSRGSVTVNGDVETLNKAGSASLVFTPSITLSDGIECGTATIVPQSLTDDTDGNNVLNIPSGNNITYYYGGNLTLSTNQTGKHCTGEGSVTLVFTDPVIVEEETTPTLPEGLLMEYRFECESDLCTAYEIDDLNSEHPVAYSLDIPQLVIADDSGDYVATVGGLIPISVGYDYGDGGGYDYGRLATLYASTGLALKVGDRLGGYLPYNETMQGGLDVTDRNYVITIGNENVTMGEALEENRDVFIYKQDENGLHFYGKETIKLIDILLELLDLN